mgnify:FL=1|tara:strand:- start:12 stop:218 length:207 start_codon:yes stop_codon:yes gene_type:complete
MRKPKIFTVSRPRALVGNMLGNQFSKYSSEELEAMVQHLEESFAKDEADKEDGLPDSVKISEPPPRAN